MARHARVRIPLILNPGASAAGVDVRRISPEGFCENQDAHQEDVNPSGKLASNAHGTIRFHSVKPIVYPIPTKARVGALLATHDHRAYRPARDIGGLVGGPPGVGAIRR